LPELIADNTGEFFALHDSKAAIYRSNAERGGARNRQLVHLRIKRALSADA